MGFCFIVKRTNPLGGQKKENSEVLVTPTLRVSEAFARTPVLGSAFDTGLLMCACSCEDTKMCFLLLPFQPCREFYCKC